MTINSTTRKTQNFVGNGNAHTYPFAFKVFADSDIVVKKLEVSTSAETTLTLGASNDYIVTLSDDQNGNPGGSITLKSGGNNFNLPSGFQIVITSAVLSLQGTDLTNQGGFYPEVINDALDKSAILHQQQQNELDRSIKFSLTNTISNSEITESVDARKNKVLSFNNDGDFSVSQEIGTYRGDWAAGTSYAARDLVKDTSTNNIFMANAAHTSSGAQPLTSNTNAANWDLIVDALAATTSANNAATSATNSANSATASANSASAAASSQNAAASSASAASTSETNANTYKNAAQAAQSAAETALDSFDDRYLGAKNSNPSLDNDGNALIDGALYFNSTSNIMRVYDLGNTNWLDLNITGTNLTNTNTVAGSINNVNTVGSNISNVNAVAGNETNINSAVSNASNINSAVSNATNINTVAGISGNVTTVAGISADVTTVANDGTDIGNVSGSIANVNTTAGSINNVNTVAGNISNVNTVGGNNANVTTVAGISSDVTTVAGISSNVTDVAGNATNINAAVSNASNINSAVSNATNINSAVSNESNITTVAGSISNVNAVGNNITNVVAAGVNVADINNFADIYQISNSPPNQRADASQLQEGDLWFDNSNDNLRVYDGTNWNNISPTQTVLDDISIVSGAITYSEDLGLITDAVATGTSNGSLDIVADALEDEITFTVTAATGKFIIDGVDKPALTLYKGWTYTFDVSDASNATHPLRFSSGGSAYNTGVVVTGTQGQAGAKVQLVVPETQPTTFAYYCTAHSGMGNTITVKDDPLKTVSDNITDILAVASGNTNVGQVAANAANINAVAGKITEVGRLGTVDAVADMAILGTTDVVADMNTLATTANVTNMDTNATNIAKIITVADDLNEGTSEIDTVATNIANVNSVGTNISNVNAVHNNATNINAAVSNASNINSAVSNESNINAVVSNATNINAVAGNNANVTTVGGSIANVNTAATNITNINTAASNLTNINNFANLYRIASSDPASNNDEGDLYFNTTSNELRVYNGSTWQGGVTASGNLAGLGTNTFTGLQTLQAGAAVTGNISCTGTVDGVDIATRDTLFGGLTSSSGVLSNGVTATTQSASDNTTKIATTAYVTTAVGNVNTDLVVDTTPQLGGGLDGQNNDLTNIGTISGANLQLDFGTI